MKHLVLEVKPMAGSSIEQVAEALVELQKQSPLLLIAARCNGVYLPVGDRATAESLVTEYWLRLPKVQRALNQTPSSLG